jgi:hypothetical protein
MPNPSVKVERLIFKIDIFFNKMNSIDPYFKNAMRNKSHGSYLQQLSEQIQNIK